MVDYRFSILKINKKNPLYRQNPFYRGQKFEVIQYIDNSGISRSLGYFQKTSDAKRYLRSHGKKVGVGVKFL